MVVNSVFNSIEGFDKIFLEESDLQLVKESLPFTMKMLELMVNQSPESPDLLLSAAQIYTLYGYGFIYRDAEKMRDEDIYEASRLRFRARNFLNRAKQSALEGLEIKYPGFMNQIEQNPGLALIRTNMEDVSTLYWLAASWGALISISKDQQEEIVNLPIIGEIIDSGLKWNAAYDSGALHELKFSFMINQPILSEEDRMTALHHYEKAVELSDGKRGSVYVAYAESVCVSNQDKKTFLEKLNLALSIDLEEKPEFKLSNALAQERAEWLKEKIDDLFF